MDWKGWSNMTDFTSRPRGKVMTPSELKASNDQLRNWNADYRRQIAKLKTMLEWREDGHDGIYCRDETISALEARRDRNTEKYIAALDCINELELRIDNLMLEYCPDEMTEEQKDNWAAHQVPADKQDTDVLKALKVKI
jgi:hypothetical protein